jgi:hypothetical protein
MQILRGWAYRVFYRVSKPLDYARHYAVHALMELGDRRRRKLLQAEWRARQQLHDETIHRARTRGTRHHEGRP